LKATLVKADKRQKPQHAKDVPLGDINRESDAASKCKSKQESDMAFCRGLDTQKNDGAENPVASLPRSFFPCKQPLRLRSKLRL